VSDPDRDAEHSGGPKRWATIIGILIAATLLGLIVFLHLSGAIGPGLH
jgi:hypothetical protein